MKKKPSPLACAREEIDRLRHLCADAYDLLDAIHDELDCDFCDALKMGSRTEPCPSATMRERLKMAAGWRVDDR